jgi:hypothetical protein
LPPQITQDVLSGFLPGLSSKTWPQRGHLIVPELNRISSFGWILYSHAGQGKEKSKFGTPLNLGAISAPLLSPNGLVS